MKLPILIIVLFFISCKERRYRIEQYYYFKGKNIEGLMWHDVKKINGVYSYKIPEGFNPNYRESHDRFDSVVFKIVVTQ